MEICVPEEFPQIVHVENRLTVGSSPSADVSIDNLSPKHCVFKLNNGILSVLNASGKKQTFLGKQKLQHGKMYILDEGDHLKLENVEVLVSRDKTAPVPQDEHEVKEDVTEITSPDIEPPKERTQTKTRTTFDLLKKQQEEEAKNHKTSKSHVGKDQLKSLIGQTLEGPKPGILTRFLCWLANVAIIYAFIFTIVPLTGIEQQWNQVLDIFKVTFDPLVALLPQNITTVLTTLPDSLYHFLIVWFLIDLASNILFSVPLPYALIGMKSRGTVISKRIRALLRSPLIILDLLIITNIQTLFKKPTLKEYVTFSEIYNGNQLIRRIGTILIIPVVIIACLISPLAQNPDAIKSLQAEVTVVDQPKVKKIEIAKLNFNSRYFNIDAPNVLDSNVLIIPHIRKKQIWLIDPSSKTEVKFKLLKESIDYQKLIQTAKKGDLLFHFNYSDLVAAGKWNLSKQDLLKKLIRNLLTLTPANLPQHIMAHGPFIASHLVARDLLLKEIPKKTSWQQHLKGELLFSISKEKKKVVTNFFTLDYPAGKNYQITAHPKAKKFAKEFTLTLFKQAKWKKPTTPKKIDGINFLDFAAKLNKNPSKEICQQMASFYKNLKKQAKDPRTKALTYLSLRDATQYISTIKEPNTAVISLLQKLQMLEIKLKDGIDPKTQSDLIK